MIDEVAQTAKAMDKAQRQYDKRPTTANKKALDAATAHHERTCMHNSFDEDLEDYWDQPYLLPPVHKIIKTSITAITGWAINLRSRWHASLYN